MADRGRELERGELDLSLLRLETDPEQVRGIMVPLLGQRRRLLGRAGLEAMNTALKLRAEQEFAAAAS